MYNSYLMHAFHFHLFQFLFSTDSFILLLSLPLKHRGARYFHFLKFILWGKIISFRLWPRGLCVGVCGWAPTLLYIFINAVKNRTDVQIKWVASGCFCGSLIERLAGRRQVDSVNVNVYIPRNSLNSLNSRRLHREMTVMWRVCKVWPGIQPRRFCISFLCFLWWAGTDL